MAEMLSRTARKAYKGLLHDIFEAGKLISVSKRTSGTFNNLIKTYSNDCLVICQEIKFREFKFTEVDAALNKLSNIGFYGELNSTDSALELPAREIADVLASFCKANEIYWDDVNTHRTHEELEAYKKSIFGEALWKFGCFLSQTIGSATDSSSTTASSKATSSRVPGAAPKNPYKSEGPKSGLVRALIGKPGEKVKASGSYVFKIVGTNPKSKVKATAHVKPLSPAGAKGSVNKVFIGSANGYTDCACFFESSTEADAFLIRCREICPDYVVGLKVYKAAADSNGYFYVDTEFGKVAISATKLNEALTEEVIDEPAEEKRVSRFPEINDIDVYSEAFNRE